MAGSLTSLKLLFEPLDLLFIGSDPQLKLSLCFFPDFRPHCCFAGMDVILEPGNFSENLFSQAISPFCR